MNALSRRLSKLESKTDQGEIFPPFFFPCSEDISVMDASDPIKWAVCIGLDEPKIWRMENESRDEFVERVFGLHRLAVGEDAMSDAALEAAIDALREPIIPNEEKPVIPAARRSG
jgi:hypothetical protein